MIPEFNVKYRIDYLENTFMNKQEYTNMIDYLFNKLKESPTGKLLLYYLKDSNITVSNYDIYNNTLSKYSKAQPLLNRIIIPSAFINTLHYTVSEILPMSTTTKHHLQKNHYKLTIPPLIVIFAHELLHLAHYYIDNQSIKYPNFEESVIYGHITPNGDYLLLNILGVNYLITENTIRNDLGLPNRISHDGEELKTYNFDKHNFYKQLVF
jgi:hypothetical protein